MRNLGRAFTIIARAEVNERIMHDDVDAFGAPSECHGAVIKGETRRLRKAKRHAKSVSGLSRAAFNREYRGAAYGGQYGARWYQRAVSQLDEKLNPFR